MKVVSLAENTSVSEKIGAEHGLSLYVETGGRRILFDMGQTDLFAKNAEILGVDLSRVDMAILSHGHYDHGGGLKTFLHLNRKAPVYVSTYAFEPHYSGTERYNGLDITLQDSGRLIFTRGTEKIGDGLTLFHGYDRDKAFDLGSFGLNKKMGDTFIPDDFRHEQYLMVEENGRRILFSGCSHKGILNIADWFRPDVMVGGFHFSSLPTDDTLAEYAAYLSRFDTDYYTCHCTGTAQYAFMKQHMDRLFYLSAGQSISI